MRREVARRRDEREPGLVRAGEELMLARRGLDALDRVEVPVLARERRAERGDEAVRLAAGAEERRDELPGLVHLLLAVEQPRQLVEQGVRARPRVRLRSEERRVGKEGR